jgi:hypothetical protein
MKKMQKQPGAKKAPVRRYDGSGHINPEHAEHLLQLSKETKEAEPEAYVEKPETSDDLAEELGEEAVVAMTSGQDDVSDERDEPVTEEQGGPFVETAGATEFAGGTDDSNIPEATREPFPRS